MTDHFDHDAGWDAIWTWGDTQAQVDAQVKANADHAAKIQRDLEIDDWLRRHPEATCLRSVAGTLSDLEAMFAKKKEAAA